MTNDQTVTQAIAAKLGIERKEREARAEQWSFVRSQLGWVPEDQVSVERNELILDDYQSSIGNHSYLEQVHLWEVQPGEGEDLRRALLMLPELLSYQVRDAMTDDERVAVGWTDIPHAEAITAWNTRTAHSGEGRSNGAGEDAADNFRECVAAELAPARDWYAKGQNHEGVLIYLLTNVMADLQSYRSGTYRSGGGTIAVGEVDPEELEDVIDDAISDSFDEEWTSRHGARHVVGAIAHEGWVVAPRVALSAPQGEVERLRINDSVVELLEDIEDEWIDHYLRPDSAERAKCKRCGGDDFFKGSIEHKPGCLVGRIRAALAQPEAGGE